jgi:hypothetical protein
VHQIRHSIKYIASKDQKAFIADLKTVYKAETLELAEHPLLNLIIIGERNILWSYVPDKQNGSNYHIISNILGNFGV